MTRIAWLGPDQPESYSGSSFHLMSSVRAILADKGLEFDIIRTPRTREVPLRALAWAVAHRADPHVYNISEEFLSQISTRIRLDDVVAVFTPFQIVPSRLRNTAGNAVFQFVDCTLAYLFEHYTLQWGRNARKYARMVEAEAESYRTSAAVFVYHEHFRDEIATRYGVSRSKIHVIGRGVNLPPRYEARPLRLTGRQVQLIFVGQDHIRKGLDRIIAGIDQLAEEERAKLSLVVAGPQVRDVPQRDYIVSLGHVDRNRREWLLNVMAGSDAGLLLSKAEGVPGFLWEMAYFNRPVICSELPQLSDLAAEPNVTMLPADAGSEQVAAALRKVIDKVVDGSASPMALKPELSWRRPAEVVARVMLGHLLGRQAA